MGILAPEVSVVELEQLRGSLIVGMDDPAHQEVLPAGADRRLFTRNLLGCTGIGRVALLPDGSRDVYFRHAYSMDIVQRKVVVPHVGHVAVATRAVIMAKSSSSADEHLEPFTAAKIVDRSRTLYTGTGVQHIVEQMSAHMDPADITIVPYQHDHSPAHPYANTFTLDIPAVGVGTFYAEGRAVSLQ